LRLLSRAAVSTGWMQMRGRQRTYCEHMVATRAIKYPHGLHAAFSQHSRHRTERLARAGMTVQYDQRFRKKFPNECVVVFARNRWCFQIDMHVLQERAYVGSVFDSL
jgi:hypothetical protein